VNPSPLKAHTSQGRAALVTALVLFGLLGTTSGCDPSVITDDQAAMVADSLLATPAQEPSQMVHVYLDRSASMRPFVQARGEVLVQLVNLLDGVLGAQFYGFGFPSQQTGQVIVPLRENPVQLLQPASYAYVNNDNGELFRALSDSTSGLHVVISDGVQSAPDDGMRYREIVESIRRWLDQGHVFAVFTFRVPYRGTYYSEVQAALGQGTAVAYDCEDRPLHLFAFSSSEAALARFRENLDAEGLAAQYEVEMGRPAGTMRAAEAAEERRGTPRYLMKLYDHGLGTMPPVQSARLNRRHDSIPLLFEVDTLAHPWRSLSTDARLQALSSLRLDVVAYDLGNLHRQAAQPVRSTRPTSGAPVTVDSAGTGGVALASITPAEGRRQHTAWVASGRLTPVGAQALVPAGLSTRDDRSPEACGQTLNLRPMLGALLQEHYVLGRAILVTEH
jgi:hypothetical protein